MENIPYVVHNQDQPLVGWALAVLVLAGCSSVPSTGASFPDPQLRITNTGTQPLERVVVIFPWTGESPLNGSAFTYRLSVDLARPPFQQIQNEVQQEE
jgi:hypothetical protein